MLIWIFASGEPLPSTTRHARLLRAGNLCEFLRNAGHEVVWWSSSFDHFNKTQIPPTNFLQPNSRLALRPLWSPGYKANLGLARLVDHAVLGLQFWYQGINAEPYPDVIWCSYPPIESAVAAVLIGRSLKVPVAIDVRDLWPDVFLDMLPQNVRPVGRSLLYPYFKASAYALTKATGLVGVTEPYLEWALRRAGRVRGPFDRCFPMGYPDLKISPAALQDANRFWRNLGIVPERFNICFFGTVGRQFDISTVLRAAEILQKNLSSARFVFCGQGSGLEVFRKKADGLVNVTFAGYVNAPEIKALMDISSVGLAPYCDTENFQLNVPNKIFEYAAGSLPIVSGVDGEVGRFLRKHDIGWVYPPQDPSSLASLVVRLEAKREDLRQRGARAREIFKNHFDAEIISAQIEAYLLELSSERTSAS